MEDAFIWAPDFDVCEQQRRRSDCVLAQSDQRLCYSLAGKYNIQTYYLQNFNIMASLGSAAGRADLNSQSQRGSIIHERPFFWWKARNIHYNVNIYKRFPLPTAVNNAMCSISKRNFIQIIRKTMHPDVPFNMARAPHI